MRILVTFTLALFSVAAYAAMKNPPEIRLFTDPVKFQDVQISPTGKYIAASMIEAETGDGRFRVIDRKTNDVAISFGMGNDKRVSQFWWVADHMLIVTPSRRVPGQDFFYPTYALMTVNLKSKDTRDLPPAAILSTLNTDANNVLVLGMEGGYQEVHKMNIRSGKRIRIARGAARPSGDGIWGFVPTRDGRIAFSIGQSDNLNHEVYYRDKQRDQWGLRETIPYGGKGWLPLWFGFRDGTFLTLDHRRSKTSKLGLYYPKEDKHIPLTGHDYVDVSPILMTDFTGTPWAVTYEHHFPTVEYINPRHPLASFHQLIQKGYRESRVRFTSVTRDHKQVLAEITSDQNAGEFIVFDSESGNAEQIAQRRPDLNPKKLARMEPFELTARDNETIYGYVTMHPETPVPGPIVVRVHGGPYGIRDYWGFNSSNQILATRGFHVLQINFRGSGGYGIDYEKAGHNEWGGLMQDDVTDATMWAIQNKLTEPGRICIMGTSYGAYSAMMGAVRNPDLYSCVVGAAGVYDLTLLERAGDIRGRRAGVRYIRQAVVGDKEGALAISPISHAEKINASVMLIHGGQDRRTPPQHAHRMKKALEDAGHEIDWLFDSGQGHGFVGEETIFNLWQRQLTFLDNHIGRNYETGE